MPVAYAKVDKAGFQLHVHVVGDGGTRVSLDTIDGAQVENGYRARHSLAHIEVAEPADIARMSQLGLTAHLTTIGLETEPAFFEGKQVH